MRKHYRWSFQFAPKESPREVIIFRVRVVDEDKTKDVVACVPVNEDGDFIAKDAFIIRRSYLFASKKEVKEYISKLVRNALLYFEEFEKHCKDPNCNLFYYDGLSSLYHLQETK